MDTSSPIPEYVFYKHLFYNKQGSLHLRHYKTQMFLAITCIPLTRMQGSLLSIRMVEGSQST